MAPEKSEFPENESLQGNSADSADALSPSEKTSVEPIAPESPAARSALAENESSAEEIRAATRAALRSLREEVDTSMQRQRLAAYDPESPVRSSKPSSQKPAPTSRATVSAGHRSQDRHTDHAHAASSKKHAEVPLSAPKSAPLSPEALKDRIAKINTQMLPRTLAVNEQGEVTGARTGKSYGSIDVGSFRMVAEEGFYRFFEDKNGAYSVSSEWLAKIEGATKITVHREQNAQGENVPYVLSGGKRYDAKGNPVSK